MTHRWIETVIGRLLTDEEFRATFGTDPLLVLEELIKHGTQLTRSEISALLAIDPTLWPRVALEIDPRLQKASLKNQMANELTEDSNNVDLRPTKRDRVQ